MPVLYTDARIDALIREPKTLPEGWPRQVRWRGKRGHDRSEIDVEGREGGVFRLFFRKSRNDLLNSSAGLAVLVPSTNRVFRLIRCNGKSHQHRNQVEKVTFYDFHIHRATERYQAVGHPEDGFAEITDRYDSFQGALDCLLSEGHLAAPRVLPPRSLFAGGKTDA